MKYIIHHYGNFISVFEGSFKELEAKINYYNTKDNTYRVVNFKVLTEDSVINNESSLEATEKSSNYPIVKGFITEYFGNKIISIVKSNNEEARITLFKNGTFEYKAYNS